MSQADSVEVVVSTEARLLETVGNSCKLVTRLLSSIDFIRNAPKTTRKYSDRCANCLRPRITHKFKRITPRQCPRKFAGTKPCCFTLEDLFTMLQSGGGRGHRDALKGSVLVVTKQARGG